MDQIAYLEHRAAMRSGDAIAFSSTGLVSRLIQWRTKSPYNHVGLVIRLEEVGIDRLFLLQAHAKQGVYLLPISRYLSQVEGRAWWYPINTTTAEAINPHYRADILQFSMLALGRPYDFKGIVQFLLPWVKADESAYFCSELASDAYRHAKLASDIFLSPAQLLAQPYFAAPISLI